MYDGHPRMVGFHFRARAGRGDAMGRETKDVVRGFPTLSKHLPKIDQDLINEMPEGSE